MKGTNPITIAVIVLVAGVFLWYVVGNSKTGPATTERASSEKHGKKRQKNRKPKDDESVVSFSKAKAEATKTVYKDHLVTFFCGCPFDSSRTIDAKTCGYKPHDAKRAASRAAWKHIVPMKRAAKRLDCWKGNDPVCQNVGGKRVTGRKCCSLHGGSSNYRNMKSDLHNIVPMIEELHEDRKAFVPGEIQGEKSEYGACDFELDPARKIYEPPDSVKGDVARAYLYMADTYGMRLKAEDRNLMLKWHKADPPDKWETERNRRIKAIQKTGNPFIENAR
jgi:deoxyribonuclease-1